MRRKEKIYKILIFVLIFILIVHYFNLYENRTNLNNIVIKNQYEYQKLIITNTSKNDYYRKMQNLYDKDPKSDQFDIYLKFKKKSESKINLGPVDHIETKPFYLIVEYTRVFGSKKFCEQKLSDEQMSLITDQELKLKFEKEKTSQKQYDLMDKCKYKNCFFSCDKDLAEKSDALLFHDADLRNQVNKIADHQNYEKVYSHLFNFKRDPSQIWLLWNDEANPLGNTLDNFLFNWTLSYNSMAEISFCTYGCLTKSDSVFNESLFQNFVKDEFKRRKNKALWFVSNCNAKARLDFVEKLALYQRIEIHGKCVDTIINTYKNKSLIEFNKEKCLRDTECEKEALKGSMFFFAFENQNCSDYITEKFWRSLHFNLIPIVLHPNKEFYEKVAPQNSYIHLADFDYDPEKLSNYLNQLSEDYKLYSKYFEWKKDYKVEFRANNVEQLRLCELCEKLNNLKNNYYSFYPKVSNFFNDKCTRK